MKLSLKPTIIDENREPTADELKRISEVEDMIENEKQLPSYAQRARNLAVEHWKTLKLAVRGKKVIVPADIAEKRFDICKQCDDLLFNETNPDTQKKDGKCVHCGCFMIVKCHYASAKCPLKKWDKIEK